jgi:CDP-glucose 4,6-dehydratase
MFDGVYSGKRVLVTGHTGFKGSWLSHWLLQLGAKVTGFSLYIPSKPSNFEVLGLRSRLDHREGDLRDSGALDAVFEATRPEVVFHLAAQAIVHASYDDPKTTLDTNFGGTVNVLEAIRHSKSVKAAVLITSDKCYENVEWEFGYRETDHLGGKDPYSASKACAEIAIRAYSCSYFSSPTAARIASTRAGNVIGGGDWARDRIIPDCARAWEKKRALVVRNPKATRPWQHVLEPVGGYLWLGSRLLDAPQGVAGEAFNFGPDADVNHAVDQLIAELGKTWKGYGSECLNGSTDVKPEAGLLKLNCDKALRRLQWRATLSFEEGVRMTGEWYQEYYGGNSLMREFADRQIGSYVALARDRGRAWARQM